MRFDPAKLPICRSFELGLHHYVAQQAKLDVIKAGVGVAVGHQMETLFHQ